MKTPDATKRLTEALTARGEAEGMAVVATAPLTLRLTFEEPAGSEFGDRKPGGGGATAVATRPTARLELVDDKAKPLWEYRVVYEPTLLRTEKGDASADSLRAAAFKKFLEIVRGLPVPWHVSQDGSVVLPAVSTLGGEGLAAPPGRR